MEGLYVVIEVLCPMESRGKVTSQGILILLSCLCCKGVQGKQNTIHDGRSGYKTPECISRRQHYINKAFEHVTS